MDTSTSCIMTHRWRGVTIRDRDKRAHNDLQICLGIKRYTEPPFYQKNVEIVGAEI